MNGKDLDNEINEISRNPAALFEAIAVHASPVVALELVATLRRSIAGNEWLRIGVQQAIEAQALSNVTRYSAAMDQHRTYVNYTESDALRI